MTDQAADLNLSCEAVSEFQELVQANLDSYSVLTEAATCMNDPVLTEFLTAVALRRAQNAEDLKRHLRLNDEEPRTSGSLGAALRQIWIDCRAAINAGDSYVMMIEAEKAELVIQTAYEQAIKHLSDASVLTRVIGQLREIREDSTEIGGLRENLKHVRRGAADPDDHP